MITCARCGKDLSPEENPYPDICEGCRISKSLEDFYLQNNIESELDEFTYRIKYEYAIDYKDIRRQIARKIIAWVWRVYGVFI